MVRIKDIAEVAQVSSATVSRILRNDPLLSVRPETRQEVLKIAEDMGYQRKKRNASQIIEVGIIQWISRFEEEIDPYYSELRKAIEIQLMQNGYRVRRFYQEDSAGLDLYNLSGLICVGKFSIEQAEQFKALVNHLVFVDSNPDSERYHSVVFDFEKATIRVLNYLKTLGHRHVGLIGGREYIGPHKEPYVDKRERTFIDYVSNDDVLFCKEDDIYIRDFSAETGYQSMLEAMGKPVIPTAFFCESDTLAMGALRALGENPKGVSIIGFNDINTAQYFNPALTTVRLDLKSMSVMAVDTLTLSLNTPNLIPYRISLSTRLIIRDSAFKL